MTDDPFGLMRFVRAQDEGGVFERALAELRAGRKRSHWMWFVFPQMSGLGSSPMAVRFAISGRAEARAYLDHELLGERLRACMDALLVLRETDPVTVLGEIDALKLRSSMTLFAAVAAHPESFEAVLAKYYDGRRDEQTVLLLD